MFRGNYPINTGPTALSLGEYRQGSPMAMQSDSMNSMLCLQTFTEFRWHACIHWVRWRITFLGERGTLLETDNFISIHERGLNRRTSQIEIDASNPLFLLPTERPPLLYVNRQHGTPCGFHSHCPIKALSKALRTTLKCFFFSVGGGGQEALAPILDRLSLFY